VVDRFRSEQTLDVIRLKETQSVIHRTPLYRKHGCWKSGKDLIGLWEEDSSISVESV
jgi:hypothetical protein